MSKIETYDRPLCLNCLDVIPGPKGCPICRELSIPLFAYGNYRSPLREILLEFKFHGITSPAATFAGLLHKQFEREMNALSAELVIPIPLYPSRARQRGYNQAALFAESLASLLGLPVSEEILYRTQKRKPQSKVAFERRAVNVRGVFDVPEETPDRLRVLLVDDVVTSGATAAEAKRQLEQAGYRVCAMAAIAHGL